VTSKHVDELKKLKTIPGRKRYLDKTFGAATDDRAELHVRALLFTMFREHKLWPLDATK